MDGIGDMLPTATLKSIGTLDMNEKGFFLIAEGPEIDLVADKNNPAVKIDETFNFYRVASFAIDFQKLTGRLLLYLPSIVRPVE
jgi:alkaline phosphatase